MLQRKSFNRCEEIFEIIRNVDGQVFAKFKSEILSIAQHAIFLKV